ncbi:hypothetical protein MKEN_00241300 [Mycena kentingensis (nom. inval.)]|nr:hypothetical protein MKEN_00241300 [Mycena kentingensis (nom. inval.)]
MATEHAPEWLNKIYIEQTGQNFEYWRGREKDAPNSLWVAILRATTRRTDIPDDMIMQPPRTDAPYVANHYMPTHWIPGKPMELLSIDKTPYNLLVWCNPVARRIEGWLFQLVLKDDDTHAAVNFSAHNITVEQPSTTAYREWEPVMQQEGCCFARMRAMLRVRIPGHQDWIHHLPVRPYVGPLEEQEAWQCDCCPRRLAAIPKIYAKR